jgi:lipoprotein signal peptidase
LGNLSDRLLHRGVTDWLQVAWWPATFNLADIAIRGRIVVALVMSAPLRRAHQSRGRPFQVDARG